MAQWQKTYALGNAALTTPFPAISSVAGAALARGKSTPAPLFAQAGPGWAGMRALPAMPPSPLGPAVKTGYAGKASRPKGSYL